MSRPRAISGQRHTVPWSKYRPCIRVARTSALPVEGHMPRDPLSGTMQRMCRRSRTRFAAIHPSPTHSVLPSDWAALGAGRPSRCGPGASPGDGHTPDAQHEVRPGKDENHPHGPADDREESPDGLPAIHGRLNGSPVARGFLAHGDALFRGEPGPGNASIRPVRRPARAAPGPPPGPGLPGACSAVSFRPRETRSRRPPTRARRCPGRARQEPVP